MKPLINYITLKKYFTNNFIFLCIFDHIFKDSKILYKFLKIMDKI